MGRHSDDDPSLPAPLPPDRPAEPVDWEAPPPVAPVWRTRIVTSAVLLLAVVAGTWWVVSWLTSPAGPGGPGSPAAATLPAAGTTARAAAGDDPGAESPSAPEDRTATTASGAASPSAPGGPAAEDPSGRVPLTVHVAGEVRDPGLVQLSAGARVADALVAAGGPTDEALLDRLNLAAPAVDASQILVPGPDTVGPSGPSGAPGAVPAAGGGSSPDPATDAGGAGGAVDLNTADAATLEGLPGIGPALAGRIVAHREEVGPFGSLEDLDAVSGIGPAMMERLDGLVSW
ncbi:ComEA family DNA-binding protein [Citricoccus sp. SGAir0253]|uniref:ComEA family DNA-binding protein n=1 Tax=Citricoccus sp. SGAir0253 TaxID=2567881 RepID=UPI0010CCBFBF|nr:ComEA family DNA-binding protein [Citricoccus sp. SGAir0253]QCU77935.1 ComEA family DNA-binding protein [Citricoccus sp. SGAir0253]